MGVPIDLMNNGAYAAPSLTYVGNPVYTEPYRNERAVWQVQWSGSGTYSTLGNGGIALQGRHTFSGNIYDNWTNVEVLDETSLNWVTALNQSSLYVVKIYPIMRIVIANAGTTNIDWAVKAWLST